MTHLTRRTRISGSLSVNQSKVLLESMLALEEAFTGTAFVRLVRRVLGQMSHQVGWAAEGLGASGTFVLELALLCFIILGRQKMRFL